MNVSRIYDQHKGFSRLMRQCKKLQNEGFCFDFWVVGDGSDMEKLQNYKKELGLENFFFLGQQENPYKYIYNADMYLCSSYSEGFSMVMMEAVILAKPQISTDVSGAREMLGDSEYGLVVENSEEGIYEGMKKILSDKKLFEHYVKKAEERKNYLDENVIMDQLEDILAK